MFKNTKKQGDWGLGIAIAHFVERGITVSIPLTDSQDYDLVIDLNEKLCKVQIKTTTYKGKSSFYKVSLTIKGGNRTFNTIKKFNPRDVDFVFIVTKDNDKYLIPSSHVNSWITLNNSFDIFKV